MKFLFKIITNVYFTGVLTSVIKGYKTMFLLEV